MPLETLYLATTPANKRLILHGNMDPAILPPLMGKIGNVKALLMTRDRSHAIELGHLEGNPRHGHHGELVPALLCEYQLNTDGLEGYDISPIPADQLEKRELEEEHKEMMQEAMEGHVDGAYQHDYIKLRKCTLHGDSLQFVKGWDGRPIVLWWLRTDSARSGDHLKLIRTEEIKFSGWKDYRPE